MAANDQPGDEKQRREAEARERYRARRQQRRHQRPARLTMTSDAGGLTLTVPRPPEVRVAMGVTFALVVASLVPIALGFTVPGLLATFMSLILFSQARSASEPTTRIRVAHDGTYQITRGSRARKVLAGRTAEAEVRISYEDDSALAYFECSTLGGTHFRRLGSPDLAVLKDFCNNTQLPFRFMQTSDKVDGVGFGENPWRTAILASVGVVAGGLGLLGLPSLCTKSTPEITFTNKHLEGSFQSTNEKLGHWTLTPSACLSGRERGFQGITFLFAAGSPVEEIRLDNARDGDSVVEVRLADRTGTVYRVRERECETIKGELHETRLDPENTTHLTGSTQFSCPSHGLSGQAAFDGCLPQRR